MMKLKAGPPPSKDQITMHEERPSATPDSARSRDGGAPGRQIRDTVERTKVPVKSLVRSQVTASKPMGSSQA